MKCNYLEVRVEETKRIQTIFVTFESQITCKLNAMALNLKDINPINQYLITKIVIIIIHFMHI